MSINFIGRIKRQWVSVLIILQMLRQNHSRFWENAGHLFFHLTIFNPMFSRRLHHAYYNVDLEEADGFIRHSVKCDDGKVRLFEMTFRLVDRWNARNPRHCPVRVVWLVRTEASTVQNLKVHSFVWGNKVFKQSEVKPFEMDKLPSEEIIRKRHRLMAKVEALRQRFSRVEEDTTTYAQRTAADIIIRR